MLPIGEWRLDIRTPRAISRVVQATLACGLGLGIGGGIGLHRRHGVGSCEFVGQNGDGNTAVLGSSLGGRIVGKPRPPPWKAARPTAEPALENLALRPATWL
jgi:hypothetical protein